MAGSANRGSAAAPANHEKALILDEEGKDLADNGEAAGESYGADSIKVLRGLDACASGRACISATPTTAPASTT